MSKRRAYFETRRLDLRARELCVRCKQPSGAMSRCERCRGLEKRRSDSRREEGACAQCGKPSVKFRRCFRCRLRESETQRRRRLEHGR